VHPSTHFLRFLSVDSFGLWSGSSFVELDVLEAGLVDFVRCGVAYRLVVFQVDLFVLQRPPQSLDVDVVDSPLDAVHADLDATTTKNSGKGL